MFRWMRTAAMAIIERWHNAARRHYLVDHDEVEAIRHRAMDAQTNEAERRQELEWLRSYQRELDSRLKTAELDANVISRIKTKVVGND